MNRPLYYQNYHKHTSLSHRYNKDSPLVFKDYFNSYNELSKNNIPQIYSTVEHGYQSPYFKIYDELESFNKNNLKNNSNYKPIKFIFGTEAYWVKDRFEKDSSNCHIVLLAMNDNGRKKINRAIYESFYSGYYYKNRMDLDILLSLPKDDIFVTSSCLAFWNKYEDINDIVLKLNNHFTNFYLEVQPHNTQQQKDVNKRILELHYKYNIPIIAGTDSHVINESQMLDREDLLRSNKISYAEEDGWFMDYPSIDVFIERFKNQGILNEDEIYESINNTNKILEFEDIILDRSLKVPVAKKYKHLLQEERNQIFKDILKEEWELQYYDINEEKLDQYYQEIEHDINEIIGCNMADYFIDNYEIIKLGQEKYGGRLTTSGRGSGVSMFLNKLLKFTKVDKINSPVLMYSERFLTKERVLESKTPPDIDHNVSEREPFIKAQKEVICEEGTFDLLALGTLHYKSAFKMYARAYNLNPQLANNVTKQITKYENALKYADDDDEKELIDIYDYVDKEKYGKLIDGCQQYMGIIDNLKPHPCFTKDALIMTDKGYKTIDKIEIGDNVLTINHDFNKVINLMRNESNDIYSLKISGSIPFEVTGNHPFFTAKRKCQNNYCSKGFTRRTLNEYEWKQTKDLKKGDLIGIAINQNNIIPSIKFTNPQNNDFWWCIGRYIGDGWRNHTIRKTGKDIDNKIRDIIICCNKKNNETNEILEHMNWCDFRISEENTINKIYVKCKGLYDWLSQFGDYAKNKHLTNEILDLPIEQLTYFLNGYISADGHIDKFNNQRFSTISKELAYGISACINKVYHKHCSIIKINNKRKEYIQGRLVNCQEKYGGSFHIDDRIQDKSFFENGYIWMPYKKKEKINKIDTVYNLEVENNHTYTVYNYIVHNCGTIAYDGDAIEDIGVIMVKSESTSNKNAKETFVAVIESGTIDAFGFLKQDYLVVDSIGLIYDIYEEIGIEPMSVNELLKAIDNNKRVWDIYEKGLTMSINQCEQYKATQKVMRYKPKNISELTQFVSAIRPSFKSMYHLFESRTHFDYGIKIFDNLLQDAYCESSFILYQENLMKVLSFAHFPMNDTYTIIKAISKKKEEKIKNAKEFFIPKFAEAIINTGETNDYKVALQLAEKVWIVIEDSASYGFNSAHAYCMAIDSVTIAWQKAYYPLETYKVMLERYTRKGNKDKVSLIKKEMASLNVKLNPIILGIDNRKFSIDRENNAINQTMSSIKNMQKVAPLILYEIGLEKHDDLFFVFKDLLKSELNKTSIEILIKLDYFREYGDINYIFLQLEVYKKMLSIYEKFSECKQLNKKDCADIGINLEEIKLCCDKETEKMFKEINNEKLTQTFLENYKKIKDNIESKYYYSPITTLQKMAYEIGLIGYTNLINEDSDDYTYIVSGVEINQYGTPFLSLYKCNNGEIINVKCKKYKYNEHPCIEGDIIYCAFRNDYKKEKIVDKDGKEDWINTDEEIEILYDFSIKNL